MVIEDSLLASLTELQIFEKIFSKIDPTDMPGFENGGLMEKEEKLRLEKGKQRLSQEEEGECIGQAEEDENGPSQLSIAAVAWSDWHMRIYFQDGRGGVHEDAYDDGVWRLSGIRNPQKELFTARLHSHLCAISWDEGQQVSSEEVSKSATR